MGATTRGAGSYGGDEGARKGDEGGEGGKEEGNDPSTQREARTQGGEGTVREISGEDACKKGGAPEEEGEEKQGVEGTIVFL